MCSVLILYSEHIEELYVIKSSSFSVKTMKSFRFYNTKFVGTNHVRH